MQTDSSASFTYLASLSASEWTTTVRMPISRQARWMRRAISPRLAMRIFSNMVGSRLSVSAGEPARREDADKSGAPGAAGGGARPGLANTKKGGGELQR